MKEIIFLKITCLLLLFSLTVNAQSTTVSFTAGTQGAGLDLKYSPLPQYGIRGGFSILPFNTDFAYSAQSTPSNMNMKVNFQNAHLLFDWHPFHNDNGFRKFMLSGGAGYFWKNTGTAVVTPHETYTYGDIVVPPQEVGQLTAKLKWHRVAPYAGIGFENTIPKHKISFAAAIGAYYMGKPDTNLDGSKLISVNQQSQDQLRENVKNYRFYPVLQLSINYSIK